MAVNLNQVQLFQFNDFKYFIGKSKDAETLTKKGVDLHTQNNNGKPEHFRNNFGNWNYSKIANSLMFTVESTTLKFANSNSSHFDAQRNTEVPATKKPRPQEQITTEPTTHIVKTTTAALKYLTIFDAVTYGISWMTKQFSFKSNESIQMILNIL